MYEISFGEWLRRQRKSLGLTQKQLAESINCATITVRKLEADQRRPSQQVVERLAHALNIPQNEQTVLNRFARGDPGSLSAYTVDNSQWHYTTATFRTGLLDSIIEHNSHDHVFSKAIGLFLDGNIHQVGPFESGALANQIEHLELSHNSVSQSSGNIILLMLVPVEIPAHLASQFIQGLEANKLRH